MNVREAVFYLVLFIFIILGSYLIPISKLAFATPYVYTPEAINVTGIYPHDPRFNIEVEVVGELVIMRVNVSTQGGAAISRVNMTLTAGNGTIINNSVTMTNTARACTGTATCVVYESNYTLKGTPYVDPGGNWKVNVTANDTSNIIRNNNTQFIIDFNLTRAGATAISDIRSKTPLFIIQAVGSTIINDISYRVGSLVRPFTEASIISSIYSILRTIPDRLLADSFSLSLVYSRIVDINRLYPDSFSITDIYSKFRSLEISFSSSFSISSVYSRILDLIRFFVDLFQISGQSLLVTKAPQYSLNSTNSTVAGAPILHSLNWTSNVGLSGYIFQFCNGTWNGTNCGGGLIDTTSRTCNATWDSTGCNSITLDDSFKGAGDLNGTQPFGCNGTQVGGVGTIMVNEVYINASSFLPDSGINATCKVRQLGPSNPSDTNFIYLWYYNTTDWINIQNWTSQIFSVGKNYSSIFNVNSTEGTHVVRCIISYNNTPISNGGQIPDECANLSYSSFYDNDDVNFTILSGVWSNDTWVTMTGATNWSNVTKTVNSTVGANISWCVYANDSLNQWNGTSCLDPFWYLTTSGTQEVTITNAFTLSSIYSRLTRVIQSFTDSFTLSSIYSKLRIIPDRLLTESFFISSVYSKIVGLTRLYPSQFTISSVFSKSQFFNPLGFASSFSIDSVINRIISLIRSFTGLFTISSNISPQTYNITVWVNGVDTLQFENCSQPVNVTVRVTKWGNALANANVTFNERDGANVYVAPQTGATSFGIGNLTTNVNGIASLAVIPTGYSSLSTYNISVNVYDNNAKVLTKYMTLSSSAIASATHSITVPNPNDVANTLTKTANVIDKARTWNNNNAGRSYSINVSSSGEINISNKTLEINVPSSFVLRAYMDDMKAGVKFEFKEYNASLMFVVPQTGVESLGIGNLTTNSSGMEDITIIPTGYSASNYNVSFVVYDVNGDYLNMTYFNITTSLTDYYSTGQGFINGNDIANTLTKAANVLTGARNWNNYA